MSKLVLTAGILAGLSGSLNAATVVYDNLADFTGDAGGVTFAIDSFEDVADNTAPPLDRGDFSITTAFDIDNSTSQSSDGRQSIYIQENTDGYIQFDFNAPITAFAIDIMDALDNGFNNNTNTGIRQLLLSIDGGPETVFLSTSTDLANRNQLFLGILSDTGISSVKIWGDTGGTDDGIRYDYLRYVQTEASVPVPAPLWLLGLGLLGLGRRKKS